MLNLDPIHPIDVEDPIKVPSRGQLPGNIIDDTVLLGIYNNNTSSPVLFSRSNGDKGANLELTARSIVYVDSGCGEDLVVENDEDENQIQARVNEAPAEEVIQFA